MKLFLNWVAVVLLVMGAQTLSAQCSGNRPCGGCTSNSTVKTKPSAIAVDAVEVYYFHMTRRCATCQAVEEETQKALKASFAQLLDDGKVIFKSMNLEKDNTRAKELGVSGQTLLVVKGDKQVNLTNVAFMNARNNPEKLSKKIKETINGLL